MRSDRRTVALPNFKAAGQTPAEYTHNNITFKSKNWIHV